MGSEVNCFNVFDLSMKIMTYLEPYELLTMELVSKSFQRAVQLQFRLLRNSYPFKYLAIQKRSDFDTDKKICARISINRRDMTGGILMIGGSFGSLHTDTCWINDDCRQLKGKTLSQARLPVNLGAVACTRNYQGNVIIAGGWDDEFETPSRDVYSLSCSSRRLGEWRLRKALSQPTCFSAVVSTPSNALLLTGGGDSPYRGANVYKDCSICRSEEDDWLSNVLPSMEHKRCGHSAVCMWDGSTIVGGGYAGGFEYLNTVERLDPQLDRWVKLRPMLSPRSGFCAVVGPSGALYLAGGSPDGTVGHRTGERYDPREGRWHRIASMLQGRGYTAGCVGANGLGFYVSGGTHDLRFQGGVEWYDFRMDRWSPVVRSPSGGPNPFFSLHIANNPLDPAAAFDVSPPSPPVEAEEAEGGWPLPEGSESSEGSDQVARFEEYFLRACHQMTYVL